ncbi:MAG: CopG family transcriptional regulator [Lachnospiraceae bacterium]|nr:CopG family transcriptional regulator [Lachnospiraceae bacterium]
MKPFIPYKQEKEVISIRIDSDTLKTVDAAAERACISRNEFINQCIAFALEHLSYRDK